MQLLPDDDLNRRLVYNVHPPDWQNPTPAGRYNLVAIGGGAAGLVSAAGAAGLGGKVALIERALLGGDCLVHGCVPSKALLRSARCAHEVRHAERFGIHGGDAARTDFASVMRRMRTLRADISQHDSARRFTELGVDVYLGDARFTGPTTIEVAGRRLEFRRAVIAAGARPALPEIPGLTGVGCLTNETVFSLTELPRRLLVIGAGPVCRPTGRRRSLRPWRLRSSFRSGISGPSARVRPVRWLRSIWPNWPFWPICRQRNLRRWKIGAFCFRKEPRST